MSVLYFSLIWSHYAALVVFQSEHQDVLDKLQFILQLVDYIINLASSRTSLLTQPLSFNNRNSTNSVGNNNTNVGATTRAKLDRLSYIDHLHKRAEQLTLYVKAMQYLSSAMCLAR